MEILYTRAPVESGEFLRKVLEKYCGGPVRIERTPNGKPYLPQEGAPKFNLTHTDGLIAVAIGKEEVGLDAERERLFENRAILGRLTPDERREDPWTVWTAKESYIKFRGATLAAMYRRLVYREGVLYEDGTALDVFLRRFSLAGCTLCLCTAVPVPLSLAELKEL